MHGSEKRPREKQLNKTERTKEGESKKESLKKACEQGRGCSGLGSNSRTSPADRGFECTGTRPSSGVGNNWRIPTIEQFKEIQVREGVYCITDQVAGYVGGGVIREPSIFVIS
jgi:hypothetical protein